MCYCTYIIHIYIYNINNINIPYYTRIYQTCSFLFVLKSILFISKYNYNIPELIRYMKYVEYHIQVYDIIIKRYIAWNI